MRKTVLCFGDSNTWGFNPLSGARLPRDMRWPGVLQNRLGEDVKLIEEGMNGRTVFSFYPDGNPLNGAECLLSCLEAYAPVHVLVVFLGINDLFCERDISAAEIAQKLQQAVASAAHRHADMRTVILPPLPVRDGTRQDLLYGREISESHLFASEYKAAARRLGCLFFDPGVIIESSDIDGVHIEADNHIKLGLRLSDFVSELF